MHHECLVQDCRGAFQGVDEIEPGMTSIADAASVHSVTVTKVTAARPSTVDAIIRWPDNAALRLRDPDVRAARPEELSHGHYTSAATITESL